MSKTSYMVYVGEVGSAYTDKVQTAAEYAAAVKNVADAEELIDGANDALESAQNALTDAQNALVEVRKAKVNATAALSNLESAVETTRAAYEAAIEHSQDSSESSAIEAAKLAYEAAVKACNKFKAILVDTDADINSLNSEDNYEDLLVKTISEINAIIVRAQAVLEEAQAYKEKATSDMENYKDIADEAAEYFESLLPEDLNKISPNEENDLIERAIQKKIDDVNNDVDSARNVIDMINESTEKINTGISDSQAGPSDDSDGEGGDEPTPDVPTPDQPTTVLAYVGEVNVDETNFAANAEAIASGLDKSLQFDVATPIYIVYPVSGVQVNAKTNVEPFGEVDVELEPDHQLTVDSVEYNVCMVELTNISVSIMPA